MGALRRTISAGAVVAVVVAGIVVASPAAGATVTCGQVITQTTKLDADVGPCSGHGIVVGANNITLDLNGKRVFGTAATGDSAGILLSQRTGVTVRGGTVTAFDAGIWIDRGFGNTLTNLTIRDNIGPPNQDLAVLGDGIFILRSADNRVVNNHVIHNGIYDGIGVWAPGANGNLIEGNVIADTITGEIPPDSLQVQNGGGIIVNNFIDEFQPDRGLPVFNNRLSRNAIRRNEGPGIASVSNIDGVISQNQIIDNGESRGKNSEPGNGIGIQRGIALPTSSLRNLVEQNVIMHNARHGIQVTFGALENRILYNRSINNAKQPQPFVGRDLLDANRFCQAFLFESPPAGDNLWFGNIWGNAFYDQLCTTTGGSGPSPFATAAAEEGQSPGDPPVTGRRVPGGSGP